MSTLLELPFVAHSETSREAAQSVKRQTVERDRGRILDALRLHRALTDEELCRVTGIAPNSLRPRRGELVKLGLVVEAGRGRTSTGRNATTWKVA